MQRWPEYLMFAEILGEVHARLLRAGRTVATAESCTGGLLATLLTELAGSSGYYIGGVSSYADSAKVAVLGIDHSLLVHHGAVSEPVALAMAKLARQRFDADYSLALTGVAGPGGGTPEKPVGTVWLGWSSSLGEQARRLELKGSRGEIRSLAAYEALKQLYVLTADGA